MRVLLGFGREVGIEGVIMVVSGSKRSHSLVVGALFLLVTVIAAAQAWALSGPSSAMAPSEQGRASLSFAQALPDGEVADLLRRHGVRAEAAYMWVVGLGGTHRVYEPLISTLALTEGFITDVRQASVSQFENGLAGNVTRLEKFIEKHSMEEVVASPALTTALRSLLNIRFLFKTALEEAQAGQPLIYAIEVTGDSDDVERARGDQRVAESRGAEAGRPGVPGPTKPRPYERQVEDPELGSLDARKLYARAEAIVREGR